MKKFSILIISLYQKMLSPYFGNNCRFYPSCSEYFKTAAQQESFLKALFIGIRRLLRCHPLSTGGWDPYINGKEQGV